MQSGSAIRKAFLDFFARHGHAVIASSPLVPHNDPTLLFTNAGMVQFKNVFTGQEKRDYVRAATSQKCVRAGGKHNDLDNVGYTARHHTFFEMLGNFSFGDYFKERAVELAWNLVTREYGLPKQRLTATVYAEDDEAFGLWKRIAGLPDSRIVRIPTSDNFWQMGDTGPCGPCSEIFFDHGDKIAGGPPGSAEADGDRFVEVWNLVFMQFEQLRPGERVPLPRPSIDTGMGLERIAAVLQGKQDNYDTDLLRSLIEASAHASSTEADGPHKISHRVIADHLRAACFLIADGVLPSNEGRGYVLRRIMRRAMRHAHMIGTKEPHLHRLVGKLVEVMGATFGELGRAQALIAETLKLEEERFRVTLERGLRLLDDELARLPGGAALPGEVAFKLYDTYGFPLDLTQDALKAKRIAVDSEGFNRAMARQRAEARKAWAGSGEQATEAEWFAVRDKAGATEFLGYSVEQAEARIEALLVDGKPAERAAAGAKVQIVLNQTPAYGESGGQMGDSGRMAAAGGGRVAFADTRKLLGDLHVHVGTVETGSIAVGEAVAVAVDDARRSALRANHSATHLLHAALRRRLGEHVTQKGSLVAPDRLRFDISHNKPLGDDERAAIEAEVNAMIRQNAETATHLMTPEAAVKAGAMALFGEKYGDEVRVVSMGEGEAGVYSTELCGGTHVRRTGDIGLFAIVSEGAVSAGVRRIEALTGEAARAHLVGEGALLRRAADLLRANPGELPDRLAALIEDRKRLERELSEARRALVSGGAKDAAEAEMAGSIKFVGRRLDGVPAKDLRGMVDDLKKKLGSGVIALVAINDDKAALATGVTADLTAKLSAVELARVGAEALGGKGGGGRPDFAQAGGPNAGAAEQALAAMRQAAARAT
ncbi:MAG: alanine--tRNA ligase [Alphaproteobacteria bacterium]|nr:alanine--tRNA ligase [Alphaproteobacteria bacterium]